MGGGRRKREELDDGKGEELDDGRGRRKREELDDGRGEEEEGGAR